MAKGNYGRFEEADWLAALARVNELKCDVEDILASRRRIGRSS